MDLRNCQTPTLPQQTVASKVTTTVPKWHPKKKTSASSREKRVSLTSSKTDLEERLSQPPSQRSSQYYSVSTDVHKMQKTIDSVEGLTFTHEQVPDELFKVIAPRISKWKILGRCLGWMMTFWMPYAEKIISLLKDVTRH